MQGEEYRLVLPAKKALGYYGGPLCGSVIAHWYHLKKTGGVFWVGECKPVGIKNVDTSAWRKALKDGLYLGAPVKIGNLNVNLSKIGYFYDASYGAIAWQFEAECVKKGKVTALKDTELEHVPIFRRVYGFKKDNIWIHITKLRRIKEPFEGQKSPRRKDFPPFKIYVNSSEKFLSLLDLMRGNAWVFKYPYVNTEEPRLEELIDEVDETYGFWGFA